MQSQIIQNKIHEIRGQMVMLDFDLSKFYSVETKVLKQMVRRNIHRFPEDFMFELTREEFDNLRSQNVTSSWGGSRYLPFAFTESGVAMLSGVLNSNMAIEAHILIIRAFVSMRQLAFTNKELNEKIRALESSYDQKFSDVYQALNFLIERNKLETNQAERRLIGFKRDD